MLFCFGTYGIKHLKYLIADKKAPTYKTILNTTLLASVPSGLKESWPRHSIFISLDVISVIERELLYSVLLA